jgi:hypothetical protein
MPPLASLRTLAYRTKLRASSGTTPGRSTRYVPRLLALKLLLPPLAGATWMISRLTASYCQSPGPFAPLSLTTSNCASGSVAKSLEKSSRA